MVVTDFLTEHFENIMDYSFTADVEKQFDDIADGLKWTEMIKVSITHFIKSVRKYFRKR